MTCIDPINAADRPATDLVLTDLRPAFTGADQRVGPAGHLPPSRTSLGVVVFSQHTTPSYGFDVDELVSVIKEMAQGDAVEASGAARYRRPGSVVDRLTVREREILAEMAQGKNNAAIAGSLFLSQRAVEKHINSIFSKLGLTEEPNVNRRVKAVLLHLEATREPSPL